MSRVRSEPQLFDFSQVKSVNFSQNRTTDPTGSSPADSTFSYTNSRNKTMTDELNPNYYHNRRLGLYNPVQPMSSQQFSRVDMPYYDTEVFTNLGGYEASTRFTGNLGVIAARNRWSNGSVSVFNTNFTQPQVVPSARSLASLTVEAVARARTSQFDLGTFAAEFNKTVAMIVSFRENTFGRANQIVRDLERTLDESRRNEKVLLHGIKTFDQAWLEGRYGWRTLAYDLKDINDSLYKLKDIGLTSLKRAYAMDKASSVSTWSNPSCRIKQTASNLTYNDWSYYSGSMTSTCELQRRAGCIVEMIMEGVAFIDPLVTAWEVIPFSFIADWFLNIGKNISAFSPFAAGNLLGVWTSERYLIDYVCEGFVPSYVPGQPTRTMRVIGASHGTYKTYYKSYTRAKVTNPAFTLSYDLHFDWQKLVDLAAIFSAKYLKLLRDIRKLNRV